MELIDTHVHLIMPDYPDVAAVLDRAQSAGVTRFVCPGIDRASSEAAIALAQRYPQIIPAVGLHPTAPQDDLAPFRELAALPVVKAIGEVGTDKKAGDWTNQEARLRFFLDLSLEVDKPVLLHVRDTWQPTLALLCDYPGLRDKAVIHCFTGGAHEAEQILDLGLLLSVTAILAREGLAVTCEVIRTWPLERLMLETDGPWLAWPGESWPNEPTTIPKIAELVADLKSVSVEDVARITTQTAQTFFRL